jgi:Ca2+-binding RTX toxin-like protein
MTIVSVSEIGDGAESAFTPATDVVSFAGVDIFANQLRFSVVDAPVQNDGLVDDLKISIASGPDAGKSLFLLDVTPGMLSQNNFLWDFGGLVVVGNNGGDGADDGINTLNGSNVGDLLMGLGGNDVIHGLNGADFIDGGTGMDSMIGGGGNDIYVVDDAGDTIDETNDTPGGVDTAMVSASWTMGASLEKVVMTGIANQSVTGNSAANTITGNGLTNTVHAGGGNDTVIGQGGNDKLWGGANNDAIRGGAGNDSLWGDGGADQFVFNSAGGAANADTIKDFVHLTDDIVLDAAIFTALGLPGDLAAGKFKAATDITATAGSTVDSSDRVLYDSDSGNLYYDANGSAANGRVLLATVWTNATDHPILTAADFTVINSSPA